MVLGVFGVLHGGGVGLTLKRLGVFMGGGVRLGVCRDGVIGLRLCWFWQIGRASCRERVFNWV